MKTKLIISISIIFLLFNSCQKIREKVFSTRMEGKVIDMQTGKGIPNARLLVYESQARQGSSNSNFYKLKTFYADKDGNFKDKIKIAFPEEDDTYESYFLKAEPDGYEKIYGNNLPNSGTGIKPSVELNLTKANKDLELMFNPEFELSISIVDNVPYFAGTYKLLVIKTPRYAEENGYLGNVYLNNTYEEVKTILPQCSLTVYIEGFDPAVNPNFYYTLDSIPLLLNKKTHITLEY
jgi:hypothetical protein